MNIQLFLITILLLKKGSTSYCPGDCSCYTVLSERPEPPCKYTNLTPVPKNISNHTVDLLLNGNPFANLPINTFEGYQGLEEVELKSCDLQYIQNGLFSGLFRLSKLDLSMNNISFIEENAFADLFNLIHLRLEYNFLTTLPTNLFCNLTNLVILRLNNNQLTNGLSPVQFENLTLLEILQIHHNNLDYFLNGTFFVTYESEITSHQP